MPSSIFAQYHHDNALHSRTGVDLGDGERWALEAWSFESRGTTSANIGE